MSSSAPTPQPDLLGPRGGVCWLYMTKDAMNYRRHAPTVAKGEPVFAGDFAVIVPVNGRQQFAASSTGQCRGPWRACRALADTPAVVLYSVRSTDTSSDQMQH